MGISQSADIMIIEKNSLADTLKTLEKLNECFIVKRVDPDTLAVIGCVDNFKIRPLRCHETIEVTNQGLTAFIPNEKEYLDSLNKMCKCVKSEKQYCLPRFNTKLIPVTPIAKVLPNDIIKDVSRNTRELIPCNLDVVPCDNDSLFLHVVPYNKDGLFLEPRHNFIVKQISYGVIGVIGKLCENKDIIELTSEERNIALNLGLTLDGSIEDITKKSS